MKRSARFAADDVDGRFWLDVAVIAATIGLSLLLGAATLRRRNP